MGPVGISAELARRADGLAFGPPVAYVYNPLVYAAGPHRAYLKRFARRGTPVLLMGMNPGPFGMAQTGVPFGDVAMVRDWMGIEGKVGRPAREHPKRPVLGFACPRREVSGTRLWGWARDRFGTPEVFFRRFFVWNYCPLCFLEASGRNRTPDKLPVGELDALFRACDEALRKLAAYIGPEFVIGVGKFAEERARAALDGGYRFGRVPHPSPANPSANRDWSRAAEKALRACGVAFE